MYGKHKINSLKEKTCLIFHQNKGYFVNKGLDAIKDQSAPIISHTYITTKIFNDKKVL